MKFALTHFLLYLVLAVNVFARGTSASVTNNAVQFIENKGQVADQYRLVRRDIDFKIEANGVVMFGGDGELHYQWQRQIPNEKSQIPKSPEAELENPESNPDSYRDEYQPCNVDIYRMDVKLVGANKNAQVIFEEPTGYYEHYYLPHTGEDGVRANGYGRVIYKDIYPNIDLVLYTEAKSKVKSQNPKEYPTSVIQHPTSNIKYDFIVHPGGNPADIKLRYEGATEIKLVDGSLVATTPFGSITEAAPYSYNAATKEPITSAFMLTGNMLSFDVGNYTGTLVIDPVLKWATYYGGSASDNLQAVATDRCGNVYIGGGSSSTTNIVTSGAHQTNYSGSSGNGFIAKLNMQGVRQWGSYYGDHTVIFDIACDGDNNVYATGRTRDTTNVATTGAHQAQHGGGSPGPAREDAFLVKFNTNGQRIWGTYYGGNNADGGAKLSIDAEGYIYMGGMANSPGGIATTGSHVDTLPYTVNYATRGFLAKFNSSGQRIWGTYYYGVILAVDVDTAGNVYIGGCTRYPVGVATTGAYGTSVVSYGSVLWNNGFIARFNSSGQRIWGTYYGPGQNDEVYALRADDSGYLYVGGHTRSDTGMATTGAHQSSLNTSNGGFLAKFNNAGIRQWGTYYGQARTLIGSIDLLNGNIYIGGYCNSFTDIAGTGAYQTTFGAGGGDAFFAYFTPAGTRLYGSYYGGAGREFDQTPLDYVGDLELQFPSTAVSRTGRLYIGGKTDTSYYLSTTGSHQATHNGGVEGFLACFVVDTIAYLQCTFTDTVLCAGDTIQVAYGVNRKFMGSNVFKVQLSDSNGSFSNPVNIGNITTDTNGTITAVIPQNTLTGSRYRLRIAASAPVRFSERNYYPIKITALPLDITATADSALCAGDTLHLYASTAIQGVTYTWVGPNSFGNSTQNPVITNAQVAATGNYIVTASNNGCTWKDTTSSTVYAIPDTPALSSNSQVCRGTVLQLNASTSLTGVHYNWWGPASFADTAQNPVVSNVGYQHAGTYFATITQNGCTSDTGKTIVTVGINTPKPTAGVSNSPLCQRQDLQLTASTVTGASYTWYGPSAFTANTQNPIRVNIQIGDAGKYYVYATVNGCVSDTDSVNVVVNTDPVVNIFPTPGANVCVGQQVIFTAVPTNGGSTSYNWLVNGISTGSTGTTYSITTLSNGDAVSCAMTSTGTCATPFIDTSNAIIMTVQPILSPTVTITADNMPPWNGGLTVTFTATPTHGGANPEYQWKRNGTDVVGATGASWGVVVNALNANEDICVVLKSSYECAVPDTAMSNCITSAFTGVGDVVNNKNIKIYPNPVSGVLHIEGVETGAMIELIDVLGRFARKQLLTAQGTSPSAPFKGGTVDVSSLVPGMYIVRVNGVVAGRVVKE